MTNNTTGLQRFVEILNQAEAEHIELSIVSLACKARGLLAEEQAQKPMPDYPDTKLYTWDEVQAIIKKDKPTAPAGLLEVLADLEHKRWSHWQTHCHKVLRENCPAEALEKVLARWDKQIATNYSDLSEHEKEMDRIEARKSLEILSRYNSAPTDKLEAGKSYWWWPECKEEVPGVHVTSQEFYKYCGHPVVGKTIVVDTPTDESPAASAKEWDEFKAWKLAGKPTAPAGLVEELNSHLLRAKTLEDQDGTMVYLAPIKEILSRYSAEPVESLAVLMIKQAGGNAGFHMHEWIDEQGISTWEIECATKRVKGNTAAECEAKAKAYLSGLPDTNPTPKDEGGV